jgi:hypothetical protein
MPPTPGRATGGTATLSVSDHCRTIAEQRVEPLVLAELALLSRVLVLDELPPLFVV